MSGNLWMFSDKLDDEDVELLKHEFITYYQGADYYGLGLKMFTRLAHEAGAVYKIGKKVLIRRTILDEYLRKLYRIDQAEAVRKSAGKEAYMKQGTLVVNNETGQMDIRFGLEDFYKGLARGTRMDVLVNDEWLSTKLEMRNSWFLVGIDTNDIIGLRVRIKL